MKRKRRGPNPPEGLGTRESWEFGYLYQGRSWAKYPSPPSPKGWPLSWVPQAVKLSEDKLLQLRGVDAALYIRFLRGCFWFVLLHSLTTFPILFPIHVEFSEHSVSPKSMTRASISSLVLTPRGLSLLWIHICLLFWITLTWIATLYWICHGAFMLRADSIAASARRIDQTEEHSTYHPHPHPQYGFTEDLPLDDRHIIHGLRLRTVMVSNLLPQLRDEKELKEYFEYYMSRNLEKPTIGINSTTQPGFINKSITFLFNHAKRLPAHILTSSEIEANQHRPQRNPDNVPVIEHVVVARKMTELASLLERREDVLRLLETAHIKLARNALSAVKTAMEQKQANKPFSRSNSRAAMIAKKRQTKTDIELGDPAQEMSEEERMEQLIKVLGPFVEEFGLRKSSHPSRKPFASASKHAFKKLKTEGSQDSDDPTSEDGMSPIYPPTSPREKRATPRRKTIWDALLSLPRSSLDAYQPLVNLSHLFRGKVVPSIDYYTAKLNLLTSLITENRARPLSKFDPVSTAFVTFADPEDARRACKYLAVHPHNPLACAVTMAPQYQDIDWIRVMKSSINAEFVKDWVVGLGVWAFTVFWLFPVSLLVGLVSIQNISTFWPSLKAYLDQHSWEEEVIQSFLPTLLVALLALLIPLILLLIGKKAHTITTLSALHDRIMTRYYKFLIVNVLVFFCVGTAALQSVLASFKATTTPDVLKVVADSFPTAGPFYVGWLIFTTAMHAGFEIALFGLPLLVYPTTRRQMTPRKRAVGTRPRTLNFYYWLPTHMLVIHVLLLFSVLNPFVLPFGAIYFFVELGVMKNQLLHVYAKNYEGNGKLILIRVVRYSLDGLILCQTVFMAYMVVLKKTVNVGLAAFLIVFTAIVKLLMTRMCRVQFEQQDVTEARVVCGERHINEFDQSGTANFDGEHDVNALLAASENRASKFTWKIPEWVTFSWSSVRHRPNHRPHRQPNPFRVPQSPTTPTTAGPTDTAKAMYHPSVLDRWPKKQHHKQPSPDKVPPEADSGPVVPHPPPIAWDDQTTGDLPYDNPFYTRTISNVLWLPRNPCGVLNLDDTVSLKVSLTVDLSIPPLGTWTSTATHSVSQSSELSTHLTSPEERPSVFTQSADDEVFDGTEDIDLPPTIAQRVENKDEDVETVPRRRPSTFSRKISSSSSSVGGLSVRRPSTASRPALTSFRSFSEGHRVPPKRKRSTSTSVMSVFDQHALRRAVTTDQEIGVRPDEQAQADFVAAHISSSRLSLDPDRPKLRRAQHISAHHAIVREVVAEEEDAYASRVNEEAAEAEKGNTTRSWLTSWMFQRRPTTPNTTPANSSLMPQNETS